MLRLIALFGFAWFVGCSTTPPRIVSAVPDSGTCVEQGCGALVPVRTELMAPTPLTSEECANVCASVWCGKSPPLKPGCELLSATSVRCDAYYSDCGYCFNFCLPDPGKCGDGCCENFGSGCCAVAPLYCRGLNCGSCPAADPSCNVAACRAFKACGGALSAEPNAAACAKVDGGVDPSVELASYCPDACNAIDAGAIIGAGCSDAGVTDAGTGDAGVCIAACQASRAACDQSCTRASYRECLDCSARCGIDLARCLHRCN